MTQVTINGQGFETATSWVVDGFTLVFADTDGGPTSGAASDFNPDGPNAGDGNLVGSVISVWTDNQIVVDYDGASHGDFIKEVVLFNEGQTESHTFDVNPDQSAVIVTPGLTFISYTSPAPDTLRLEAAGGLFSGGAVRLLMSFSNGTLFASNPDDPNEAATNAGNGITVNTWTDTVVEVVSPFIPTGTALAVAVQADLAVTIDEWQNTDLEGPSGFAPFNAL